MDIRDLKVGDVLVCTESFSDIFKTYTKWFQVGGEFVVISVCANAFMVDDGFILHESKLKFFKKKEDKTPHNFGNVMCDKDDVKYTFDDLIDVAVQAKKDGGVFKLIICDESITICSRSGVNTSSQDFYSDNIVAGIDYIKALYKETFVIESEDDIKRIKIDAKVTLKNGLSALCVSAQTRDFDKTVRLDCGSADNIFGFFVLKGATVEQKLN